MSNPWFRLYHEWDSDPKVQSMPEVMQRRLVMLFCSKCRGEKLKETERAFHWRISDSDLAATKAMFVEKGFIDEKWNLVNWNQRQFLSDSSTDRVRKYRQALKHDETLHETAGNVTVTAPDTETEAETEPKAETKQRPSRAKKPREVPTKPPKEARPSTKTDVEKTRHAMFKSAILIYWQSKNPGVEMPWDGSEGKQLAMWMKASPNTTLPQFTEFLRNRFRSEVNHSERPSLWIRNVTSFAAKPTDRFGKQIHNGGTNGHGKLNESIAAKQEVLDRRRERRMANEPDCNSGGSETGLAGPEPGSERPTLGLVLRNA